mmetsp:Transcript_19285/g.46929  ORF Transcript_19285/g.46929 Transcript_19285/m.46929 type:complete len:332 (+) Transcript_19285:15-1010(+)
MRGATSSEMARLLGVPRRRLATAGAAAACVLVLCALVGSGGGSGGRNELEGVVSHAQPAFEWNDDTTEQFVAACKAGDEKACETLSGSDEALAILNSHSRQASQPLYVVIEDAVQGAVPEQEEGMMGEDWDDKVPLAVPISQEDLLGAGDDGNVLVPASEVRPKPGSARRGGDRRFSAGSTPSGTSASEEPMQRPVRKHHKGLETIGLAAVPRAGFGRQWGLLPIARQGLARKPMYSPTDPCRPNGPLCGPTRPSVDYGGDLVLTDGWLNEPTSDEKACCPCLGKGVKRINYDDYPGAGQYNPYTMEVCKVCAGCELVEDPGKANAMEEEE